ncbi:hypothetical protein ACLBWP_03240 [Microbacterium sp. M1A1_1b]
MGRRIVAAACAALVAVAGVGCAQETAPTATGDVCLDHVTESVVASWEAKHQSWPWGVSPGRISSSARSEQSTLSNVVYEVEGTARVTTDRGGHQADVSWTCIAQYPKASNATAVITGVRLP